MQIKAVTSCKVLEVTDLSQSNMIMFQNKKLVVKDFSS